MFIYMHACMCVYIYLNVCIYIIVLFTLSSSLDSSLSGVRGCHEISALLLTLHNMPPVQMLLARVGFFSLWWADLSHLELAERKKRTLRPSLISLSRVPG